jgi:hypothetical protein
MWDAGERYGSRGLCANGECSLHSTALIATQLRHDRALRRIAGDGGGCVIDELRVPGRVARRGRSRPLTGELLSSVRLRVIVCEGGGQLTIGIGLLLKRCGHLFGRLHSICACHETAWRLVLTGKCNQCLCELSRVARLLTVVAFPKFHLLHSALVVIVDGPLREIC